MNDNARRVVLLARPGAARDRMREALDQAGANIVLEADPATGDQAAVLAAQPEAALVMLDPAMADEALDRFDGVLSNPQIEILFEEAELAVGRVGWDAARWVRHLRAKLGLSDTVLPPGRATSVAEVLPESPAPVAEAAASVAESPEPVAAAPAKWELTLSDLDDSGSSDTHLAIEPVEAQLGTAQSSADLPGTDEPGTDYPPLGLEDDAGSTPTVIAKFELELVDDTPTEIMFEGLEMAPDQASDASRFRDDMADLHSRVGAMELVHDRTVAPAHGAVLVLAGIGGPDAVRQLLGALPEGFPRAVLIQQRLDGGHYDKLVAQMQRATSLPVKLAVSGDTVQPATIYILPPSLGVHDYEQGLAFNDAPGELLTGLPANDSAVLMLSGSDPAQVDAVMKLAANGALIASQALDGCYDVAAPAALASRGGQSGKPQELARRLAQRWL
ncbi:chemotaxis protein CheB [Lysobacter rhizosphaerae]